jgi:hypothetical protein
VVFYLGVCCDINPRDAGRGQGFVKHCLTLTERASDATRAPAYEPIPAASTINKNAIRFFGWLFY